MEAVWVWYQTPDKGVAYLHLDCWPPSPSTEAELWTRRFSQLGVMEVGRNGPKLVASKCAGTGEMRKRDVCSEDFVSTLMLPYIEVGSINQCRRKSLRFVNEHKNNENRGCRESEKEKMTGEKNLCNSIFYAKSTEQPGGCSGEKDASWEDIIHSALPGALEKYHGETMGNRETLITSICLFYMYSTCHILDAELGNRVDQPLTGRSSDRCWQMGNWAYRIFKGET